ncbi:lactococcin 972 family bacteriocin [Streptomyces sp. NPDC059861]|uniref:lactococcin 972 family bacteriocin n=1 Tax=Streptomyces sp. NPDC059861 TaxID=3346974 RepID=UPI0036614BEB
MAVIKVDPNSRAASSTTEDVGGGTWTYGTEITADGKRCFSYYFHGTKLHKATAKIGNGESNSAQPGGITARASLVRGASYTCYTFWSNLE